MFERYSTKATVTKIRALYSKMLKSQHYSDMLNKQTVAEIASYLKNNTHYSDILANVDTANIHRGYLESLVKLNNFNLYVKLLKFQGLDKYEFYNYELTNSEIHHILRCILATNIKAEDTSISSLPSFLISHSKIDMMKLSKCKNFNEILLVINGTIYYKLLKNVEVLKDGTVDYLLCERILITYYYEDILVAISKEFSEDIAKELKDIILTRIDLTNLHNVYRLKAYYNGSKDDVTKVLIPYHGKISKNRIKAISGAKDEKEMLSLMEKTKYMRNMDKKDEFFLEQHINEVRYKNLKKTLRNASDAPVAFYSFMKLCEIECNNVITVTEGIRYKASPEFIEQLLII